MTHGVPTNEEKEDQKKNSSRHRVPTEGRQRERRSCID